MVNLTEALGKRPQWQAEKMNDIKQMVFLEKRILETNKDILYVVSEIRENLQYIVSRLKADDSPQEE